MKKIGKMKMKMIKNNPSMSLRAPLGEKQSISDRSPRPDGARDDKSIIRDDKNRGFALLYAILIMFLFMITVSAIAFSSLAEIRQYKQAKSSLGALMAAQSGIEAGLANKSDTSTCSNTTTQTQMTTDPLVGSYILSVCSDHIQSTGIFSGVKIKIQADNINVPANIKIYQVGI